MGEIRREDGGKDVRHRRRLPDYRSAREDGREKSVAGIAARDAVHGLDYLRAGGGDDVLVLFALERAGGVDQKTIRRELREAIAQNGDLAFLKRREIFRLELPLNFRIAGQRAGAGTGSVDQDAVEQAAERKRMAGVEYDHRNAQRGERSGAAEMKLAGDGAHRSFD